MASGYTEGEIERLRRSLSQAHQELSDERARSAKLLDEVGRLRAEVEDFRTENRRVWDRLGSTTEANCEIQQSKIKLREENERLRAALREVQHDRDFVVRCNDYIIGAVDRALGKDRFGKEVSS